MYSRVLLESICIQEKKAEFELIRIQDAKIRRSGT